MGRLMDIAKAVAASVRGMGLNTGRAASANLAGPELARAPLSPAEVRIQRANLQLLDSAKVTLERTIALLK